MADGIPGWLILRAFAAANILSRSTAALVSAICYNSRLLKRLGITEEEVGLAIQQAEQPELEGKPGEAEA